MRAASVVVAFRADDAGTSTATGPDVLRAIRNGALPQAAIERTLRFGLSMVRAGHVTFSGIARREFSDADGQVHGGFAATLLTSAMIAAVQTVLAARQRATMLEFKVSFLRSLQPDESPATAIGSVVHLGSTHAAAEGRLVDSLGQLFATATGTLTILHTVQSA